MNCNTNELDFPALSLHIGVLGRRQKIVNYRDLRKCWNSSRTLWKRGGGLGGVIGPL